MASGTRRAVDHRLPRFSRQCETRPGFIGAADVDCFIALARLSQRWRLLDPTARVNLTGILVFRLRDVDELDQVIRSLGAKYGYKQTREIYDACTSEPYSFMYYNALTNTFYCRFEHKVEIEGDES